MSDAPGLADLPFELLAAIAGQLDMADLNALRLASKRMKAAADDAAAREAKKIQGFLKSAKADFKREVLGPLSVGDATFDQLKGWAAEVKAAKPPTISMPGRKAEYKEKKLHVTKALIEFAQFLKEVKASIADYLQHLDELHKLLGKDLQVMASVDRKERTSRRGGKLQLTYDELEDGLATIENLRSAAKHAQAQTERYAAELTDFGKAFSSKYAEA